MGEGGWGRGGVAPCSLSDLSISSSHLSGYEFHGERRDRTRRHMCTHVQNASDGVVSDSLIGEQVGKIDNVRTATLACRRARWRRRRSDGQAE